MAAPLLPPLSRPFLFPGLSSGGLVDIGPKPAVAARPAHRYWRLRTAANNGDFYLAISEVEFRAEAGGADQAVGGTASESAFNTAGQEGSKAFDNNANTFWASQGQNISGAWVKYDFGTPVSVAEVAVRPRADQDQPTQAPRAFFIEGSDDNTSWSVYARVENEGSWAQGETRVFAVGAADLTPVSSGAAGAARYWRVYFTANNGDSFLIVPAVSWKSSAGVAVPVYGAVAHSARNSPSTPPGQDGSRVIDGLTNTFWAVGGGGVNQWLRFDFLTSSRPGRLMITARIDANAPAQAAKDFKIESSSDASTWTTVSTVTGQTSWAQGETREFSF